MRRDALVDGSRVVRPPKLTREQHKELAERHLLYLKNTPRQLAKDYGISPESLRQYLRRPLSWHEEKARM